MTGSYKAHKIGDMIIHGTDQDFPKSPSEALSVRYKDRIEKELRNMRKTKYKREIDPIRNRFDRMKSYCLKNKIDWRVDFRDYERLWETAPEVFSEEKGRMIPAIEATNRRSGVRATRIDQNQRFVDITNLVLKQGSVIIHGPLSP